MTVDPFVGLHVHSEYSFLDGRQTIQMMVARAVELEQNALATTDHGECSGHVEFEKECKKQEIKPIFGMEGYLVHDTEERERNKDRSTGHITLLAKTQLGLKNVWKLSTTGYQKFYQKPVCDWGDFRRYSQDVIATDGCLFSWMAKAIKEDNEQEIERLVQMYLDTFGENFYMELHTWQIPEDPWVPLSEKAVGLNADMTKVNQRKVEIAAKHGIPMIVVNDAHYDKESEARNHQLIWQMSTNADQTDGNEIAIGHMMGSVEIVSLMRNHGISDEVTIEAILNTRKIADSCEDVTTGIFDNRVHIPLLSGSEQGDVELFRTQSEDGYERKYVKTGRHTPETRKRKDYEDDQIIGKRFAGYHVIVADYCKFAKGGAIPNSPFRDKEPWLVGPTRGSGGGSINNFCLDITEADPMAYGIPFERYIDPGRKSFPDIDLDFPQSKRPEMKRYAQWKYGHGCVASIGTFSKIGFKQAVRDLGRAMGIPYPDCDRISKLIEQVEKALKDELDDDSDEAELTWEDVIGEKAAELLPWVQKYPEFFKHMQELVGIKRHHGIHPSGILISPVDLFGELPMRVSKKTGEMVTQFDMYTVEELGFIKFDILGIRHLDTIMITDKFVHGAHDPRRFYDMTVEQLSDAKTAELIASGESLGIFTLETPGMTATAKRMMPTSERDVSHLTSLQRPGVIKSGGVERFLRRRAGRERPKTPHPLVDEILKDTYGVFVYQDQVLEAVRVCAGYSFTESDRFRKILGKKKMDQMRAEKDAFLSRCLENQEFVEQSIYYPAVETAQMIWDEIEPAGMYCVTGDTVVTKDAGGGSNSSIGRDVSVRELYEVWNARSKHPRYQSTVKYRKNGLSILAHVDGRIKPQKMIDVFYQGVQPVWEVKLENGKKIKATANHRHFTNTGWKTVDSLTLQDSLATIGEYEKFSSTRNPSGNPVCLHNGNRLSERRAKMELPRECFRCGKYEGSLEVAHLDNNPQNWNEFNVVRLCNSCHKKQDYSTGSRKKRQSKGRPIEWSQIVSIEYVGEQDTYDVSMAPGNDHSWLANGIVTHNSFNLAHALGYGLLSWWSAYQKANHYFEDAASLMITDSDRVPEYLREARFREVKILPPNINKSAKKFVPVDGALLFGLDSIDKVGDVTVEAILLHRATGEFKSLADFFRRVPGDKVNKGHVVNLISIGAFDDMIRDDIAEFGLEARNLLLEDFFQLRANKSSTMARNDILVQHNFSTILSVAALEYSLVKTYITNDPDDRYTNMISEVCCKTMGDIQMIEPGLDCYIGGKIVRYKIHKSAKPGRNLGRTMAFLEIAWRGNEFEAVCFFDAFEMWGGFFDVDAPIIARVERTDKGSLSVVDVIRLDWLLDGKDQ